MRRHSLQLRLAVRLAIVYVIATAIAVGVLVYRAYDTAGSLNDRELSLRAQDLANYMSIDSSGRPRLDLPAKLSGEYAAGSGADIFAVRGPDGRVIAASPPSFGERVTSWPLATDDPSYFRISEVAGTSQDYYGLSLAADGAAGRLSISVARSAGSEALVHSLLQEFVIDIAWIIPVLVIVTLAIGILAIRGGLKPLRNVSKMAAMIGPSATSVRLPEGDLPSEITPLVAGMNRALDRLEQGFAVQRQFTANAAHELRTPLAIVTAALEAMEGDGELAKLRNDVARMNRLVEQLLRVARLDAIALDLSGIVDLSDVAAATVSTIAPWVVAQGKSIALAGAVDPVRVRGNAHAVADAIRNLIENAVAHSPEGSEVVVTLSQDGSVSVADQGCGVPTEDRDRIFDRFWRGKGEETQGAGLGLAIVKEIVKAHQGAVTVENNLDGGAVFTLCFALANSRPQRFDRLPSVDAGTGGAEL
jgi:two-component system, OmpR family, sensor histidine kinase TctE